MPGYVARALQRFEHPLPTRSQDSPHPWLPPQYGSSSQLAPLPDVSGPASQRDAQRVPEVLGTLLFYARAIDCTMLLAINTLAAQQASPTTDTVSKLVHLLNYAACHPDAVLRYRASDMTLWAHSDASYLSEPQSRSRYAGYFFLSDALPSPPVPPAPGAPPPTPNGPLYVVTHRLKEVVASAAEAELAGLFHNGRDAVPLRQTLTELGFPQGPTPIQTDNTTAAGIATDSVTIRRSKAMDMRYFWVQDRVAQGQFLIYWDKGILNFADYFTKHHPASHHRVMRPYYLHTTASCALCDGSLTPRGLTD